MGPGYGGLIKDKAPALTDATSRSEDPHRRHLSQEGQARTQDGSAVTECSRPENCLRTEESDIPQTELQFCLSPSQCLVLRSSSSPCPDRPGHSVSSQQAQETPICLPLNQRTTRSGQRTSTFCRRPARGRARSRPQLAGP